MLVLRPSRICEAEAPRPSRKVRRYGVGVSGVLAVHVGADFAVGVSDRKVPPLRADSWRPEAMGEGTAFHPIEVGVPAFPVVVPDPLPGNLQVDMLLSIAGLPVERLHPHRESEAAVVEVPVDVIGDANAFLSGDKRLADHAVGEGGMLITHLRARITSGDDGLVRVFERGVKGKVSVFDRVPGAPGDQNRH